MRLKGLYIDGFGLFHDLTVEGLSPGLTIFLGRNESGKSTLLGFLRAILFGFPDGRTNENPYPPLRGGRHGGNIILETQDREVYVAERYAGPMGGKVTVLKPDDSHGDKAFLDRLLGMVDRSLFRNVYGFSLSELQHFESLNTESLRETLFSAGAGLNPGALARFRAELEKREALLFKPAGSKPKINQIIARLTAIMKEKRALYGVIDQYDHICLQISESDKRITALEKERAEVSLELKRKEQLIRGWSDWINLLLARRKLGEVEVIEDFPEDGLNRYETLKLRLEDAQKALEEKVQDLGRQEEALAKLKTAPDILGEAASIQRLQRDQGRFDAVSRECISLREEISGHERKVKEGLIRLGPFWDEEKISAFDVSMTTREEVRRFRETLKEAVLEEKGKRESLEPARSRQKEAEAVLSRLPGAGIEDQAKLERMRTSCRRLKGHIAAMDSLKHALSNVDEHLEDVKGEKAVLEEAIGAGPGVFPLWPIPAMIGAGLLFLVWSWQTRAWVDALPVTVLMFVLGLGLWIVRSRRRKKEENRDGKAKDRLSGLVTRIEGLEGRRTEIRLELDRVRDSTADAMKILALPAVPSEETLDRLERELGEKMKIFDLRQRAEEDLEEAKRNAREAAEGLSRARAAVGEIQSAWEAWLDGRGLDRALSPEGGMEALSLIESGKEQIGSLHLLREKRNALDEERERYIRLVNEVLSSLKRTDVSEADVPAVAHALIQEFSEAERASQKRSLLLKETEASRGAIERMQKQIQGLQKELGTLLAAGGAEGGESFRKRAVLYEARRALKKEMERSEDNLRRAAGSLGGIEKLQRDLSETSLEVLEEERHRLENDLKETEASLDRVKRDQARLEEQARHLIDDDRISSLRVEEESLKETLSYHAREWCVVRMAQGLVRMARERYEREMRPQVIAEAARFFERLTLGRYPSLAAPIGENRLEVVGQDNSRKGIHELSRGTAEQLYLSIRFGFIREFSRTSEPLPVIMDEVLVNFDPERAGAAAEAILEISRERQVLFFTCRPETVSRFRDLDPHTSVVEIAEGGVFKPNDGNP